MSESPSARILVVEDDRTTADLVALYLRHAGFDVHVDHTGDAALARVAADRFDLLVLDVMLPGASGLEICRRVRAREGTGVILLTARTSEDERVRGLELGADDYVSKPFSPRELVARAKAVLRRRPPGSGHLLVRGEVTIDLAERTVAVQGRRVDLTPSEFAILETLARRPGHVRTRAQLLDAMPGDRENFERTVDVHVRNLRRKIEPIPAQPRYVQTVLGAGYRFSPDPAL